MNAHTVAFTNIYMFEKEELMLNKEEYDALLIAIASSDFSAYENSKEMKNSLFSAMNKITDTFTINGIQDATDYLTRTQRRVTNG